MFRRVGTVSRMKEKDKVKDSFSACRKEALLVLKMLLFQQFFFSPSGP